MGKEGGTQACEEVKDPCGKGKQGWSQCPRREQIPPEEVKRGKARQDSSSSLTNCLPRQGTQVPPLVWE